MLALFGLLVTSNILAQEIDYKGFPEWSWHKQDSTEYYLYTPAKMKNNERYPVALFLHGCCGKTYTATLRNAVDPPARMWHNFGENTQTIPTYIISAATSRGWRQHIDNLKHVIDDLVKNGQADPKRIYISGFSMGGDGTIAFIEKYPEYFAAALPMGMDFRADFNKIKNIPIWTNKGETDWFARNLNKAVADIRKLNGDSLDSSANYVTGVNPVITEFKGQGHGVQWIAASTQDLTGWAYSKINDGNKYPSVFFISPQYGYQAKEGESVDISVDAIDADGSISKVEFYSGQRLIKTITSKPFSVKVVAAKGDTEIRALAFDNKGKFSTATTRIKVNIPTDIRTPELPYARQGAYYQKQIFANGNGIKIFSADKSTLPDGLVFYPEGILKGVPSKTGSFKIIIRAHDEDGDATEKAFDLLIKEKSKNEVLVTNARNNSGRRFPVSKLMPRETPVFNSKDTVLTTALEEINFSDVGTYYGLTLIKTDASDTARTDQDYLSFDIDQDAEVLVGYEKLDRLFKSTVPSWLKTFSKQPGEIVAQYFYYDLYMKKFPKGKVVIPGADEKRNGVHTNYFVLVRKSGNSADPLEITTRKLVTGNVDQYYEDQLTSVYGSKKPIWRVVTGNVPAGLVLDKDGRLSGTPAESGTYNFTVEVSDSHQNVTSKISLIILK
jgi:hypothetical protein